DACVRTKWLKTWDFDCEHAIGGVRATDPPPPAATTPIIAEAAPKEEKKDEEEAVAAQPEQVALTSPSAASADIAGSVVSNVMAAESSSIGSIADIVDNIRADDVVIENSNPVAVHVEPQFEAPAIIPPPAAAEEALYTTREPALTSVVSAAYSDVEDTGVVHAEL
ncbi:hypothetical protein GGF44_006318, partial [Coemansia sp. RSA 1694]